MQKPKFIQQRNNTYYYRQVVPLDLIAVVQKREIVLSLRTGDLATAIRRADEAAKDYFLYFDDIRKGIIRTAPNGKSSPQAIAVISLGNATQEGYGKTLTWLLQEWIKHKITAERQFKRAYFARRVLRAFQEVHGDICIGELQARHLIEFKKHLQFKCDHQISAKTKNGYLDLIKNLMAFAHDELLIQHNPVRGLRTAIPEDDCNPYRSFTASELHTILLSAAFTSLKSTNPDYFWITIIALCTGCRLEEVAQLHSYDVKQEEGVAYFDINSEGGIKHLKTQASSRVIPIHKELIALGLLDYVRGVSKSGGVLLFPNLKPYKGVRAHNFGKWFSRYKKSLGLPDTKVFHSFRHTFKDLCRDAGVSKEVHDRLTGHSSTDIGDSYGYGPSLKTLNSAIQKLRFPVQLKKICV